MNSDMKVLSIIIPAYNSAAFLDKGVSSLLHEGVLEKLAIIIFNDGSSDETAAIAQKYCDRYPDSIRLISQENRGHGGALNTGCNAAVGKYLKAIDADDGVALVQESHRDGAADALCGACDQNFHERLLSLCSRYSRPTFCSFHFFTMR